MHAPDDKANLWISFGSADVPGWVVSGHTDTVPVDGKDGSVLPHALSEADGRYFGRGTCDMKEASPATSACARHRGAAVAHADPHGLEL